MNRLTIVALIILFSAQFGGCAFHAYDAETVLGAKIETVPSKHATIAGYWATDSEYGVTLTGHLRKPLSKQGRIQGRMLVQLIDAEGNLVEEIQAALRSRSVKSRTSKFTVTLTGKLEGVECVRLIYDHTI